MAFSVNEPSKGLNMIATLLCIKVDSDQMTRFALVKRKRWRQILKQVVITQRSD